MRGKKKRFQRVGAWLICMAMIGFLAQSCASSSGYHKRPPTGSHFKCK